MNPTTKLRIWQGIAGALALGLVASLLCTPESQSSPPRFTISSEAMGDTFVLDTREGHIWRYYRNTDDAKKLISEGFTYLPREIGHGFTTAAP